MSNINEIPTNQDTFLYYGEEGFYAQQNPTNSRYKVTSEYKEQIFNELSSHSSEDNLNGEWKIVPDLDGKPIVKYIERSIEEIKEILRRLRANRVFPIINRSNFWFNSLTQQQKDELQIWYQEWLDAPDTLTIPTRPEWLE